MTPEGAAARRRIVLTRTSKGNEQLARRARALGFEPISVESIQLLPPLDWSAIDASLGALGGFDWLMFTSSRGARMFKERIATLQLDLKWQGRPSVAAVGEGTAEELRSSDIHVAFVPSEFLTQRLASELPTGTGQAKPRVLLLRSDIADPRMVEVLLGRGFEVVEHAIYRTEAFRSERSAPPDLEGVDAILFASPSAVEGFTLLLGGRSSSALRRTLAACIGPVTAKSAMEHGFERIITPKTHTFDALLQEVGRELSMVAGTNG